MFTPATQFVAALNALSQFMKDQKDYVPVALIMMPQGLKGEPMIVPIPPVALPEIESLIQHCGKNISDGDFSRHIFTKNPN